MNTITPSEVKGAESSGNVVTFAAVASARVKQNFRPVYKVRPAPPIGWWYGSPDCFIEITRLSDGKISYARKQFGDESIHDDAWAHDKFVRWQQDCDFWRNTVKLKHVDGDSLLCGVLAKENFDIILTPACFDVFGGEIRDVVEDLPTMCAEDFEDEVSHG